MSHGNFSDIELVDPYVDKGWTPTISLTLATDSEVDQLESKVGPTPVGYREYVTLLGRGEYCSYIRVDMPSQVLAGYQDYQKFIDEYWFWELSEPILPKKVALASIYFASTVDGDAIFFNPDQDNEIFVLPRHDDKAYVIGFNLCEAIDWMCVAHFDPQSGHVGEEHKERYFIPYNPLAYEHGHLVPERFRRHT